MLETDAPRKGKREKRQKNERSTAIWGHAVQGQEAPTNSANNKAITVQQYFTVIYDESNGQGLAEQN